MVSQSQSFFQGAKFLNVRNRLPRYPQCWEDLKRQVFQGQNLPAMPATFPLKQEIAGPYLRGFFKTMPYCSHKLEGS